MSTAAEPLPSLDSFEAATTDETLLPDDSGQEASNNHSIKAVVPLKISAYASESQNARILCGDSQNLGRTAELRHRNIGNLKIPAELMNPLVDEDRDLVGSGISHTKLELEAKLSKCSAGGKFTVFVRDEEFTLRKSQLEFDAPNFFTAYFFGDYRENAEGVTTLHVDRNPDLFAILVEYMSGYSILPLSTRALPRTMDMSRALRALAEDAAYFGLSRLHAMLTGPKQPSHDLSWAGFSARVVRFEDVLHGKLPENVSYTTSGLCCFDCGAVRPVVIFAQNIALKLVGNPNLDLSGRPDPDAETATYRLCLSPETKAQLVRQPYSAFQFNDSAPRELSVSVTPDARLHLDGVSIRFEHFAHWWRIRRRVPLTTPPVDAVDSEKIFDMAFPQPFEDRAAREDWNERCEFSLWGDELMFVIGARGFIAGTLQLYVKLLDVRARSRSEVLSSLRPPYLTGD